MSTPLNLFSYGVEEDSDSDQNEPVPDPLPDRSSATSKLYNWMVTLEIESTTPQQNESKQEKVEQTSQLLPIKEQNTKQEALQDQTTQIKELEPNKSAPQKELPEQSEAGQWKAVLDPNTNQYYYWNLVSLFGWIKE